MSIRVICSVCKKVLTSGPAKPVSHGLCRLHELETYEKSNLFEPGEKEELKRLRDKTESEGRDK